MALATSQADCAIDLQAEATDKAQQAPESFPGLRKSHSWLPTAHQGDIESREGLPVWKSYQCSQSSDTSTPAILPSTLYKKSLLATAYQHKAIFPWPNAPTSTSTDFNVPLSHHDDRRSSTYFSCLWYRRVHPIGSGQSLTIVLPRAVGRAGAILLR